MQGLITVFGGTGFVGRYVVRALARDGWRVRVAARKPNQAPELRVMGEVGQVELFTANVRDPMSIAAALDGATGVVNLVGVLYESGRQGFQALHVKAARDVAQAAAARGITTFVQMSALGADADSPSAYGRTKAEGEAAVTAAVPSAAIVRPSIVFGPEDDFFNRFAAMAPFAPALPLIGGGKTRFAPVYAGDVGEAIAAIIAEPTRFGGRVFELGGAGTYDFKALMQIMLQETQRSRPLIPLPFGLAAPLALVGDVAAFFGLPPTLTSDQLAMLRADSMPAPGAAGLSALNVIPTPLESVLPTYLWRFRNGGQFADPKPVSA